MKSARKKFDILFEKRTGMSTEEMKKAKAGEAGCSIVWVGLDEPFGYPCVWAYVGTKFPW